MKAMNTVLRHHNRGIFEPSRRAAARIGAIAALALVVLIGAPSARAASAQKKTKRESAEQLEAKYRHHLAVEDVNVGKFYKNKARYEAAISRFLSAVKRDPGWAVPYELLGETYEKKNDPERAVAAYRKYLKILPYGKNAKKIRKRVEKLTSEIKARAGQTHKRERP